METGSYRVELRPWDPLLGDVVPANFCGSSVNYFNATAEPVAVTDGAATAGIDQQLDRAAEIRGRVTDAAGNPLKRHCVTFEDGPPIATREDGSYGFFQLRAGTYDLNSGAPGNFFVPPSSIRCEAGYVVTDKSFTVADGQALTGANIVLRKRRPKLSVKASCVPASIPGEVTCTTKGRLGAVEVCSGTVRIRYAAGKRVLRDLALVTRRCTYESTFLFVVPERDRGRLTVRVTYKGNAYNRARRSKPVGRLFS